MYAVEPDTWWPSDLRSSLGFQAHICWPRTVSPPVPKACGPRWQVAAARTVQRTVPPALEPIFAESAGLSQTSLSFSTKAGATPDALSKCPSSFHGWVWSIVLYLEDNPSLYQRNPHPSLVTEPPKVSPHNSDIPVGVAAKTYRGPDACFSLVTLILLLQKYTLFPPCVYYQVVVSFPSQN